MGEDSNLQGAYVGPGVTPWFLSVTAAQKEFRAAFDRYVGGEPAGGDMVGWVAGKLFEAALRGNPAKITGQAVMDGLYALKNESLGGLAKPLNYVKGKPAPATLCGAIAKIQGNRFTAAGDGSLTCF